MRTCCVVLLTLSALLVMAPSSVFAQVGPDREAPVPSVRPEVQQRVEQALLAIEGEAPDSFYTSLGSAGRDALLAIVRSSRPMLFRRRAILALHHYPEPLVRAELQARADADGDPIVSRYALQTLGLAFGSTAFDFIATHLSDERAFVREGAAIALHAVDAARAAPLLRARLSIESELFVRRTIERL